MASDQEFIPGDHQLITKLSLGDLEIIKNVVSQLAFSLKMCIKNGVLSGLYTYY